MLAGSAVSAPFFLPRYRHQNRKPRSRVAVINHDDYSERLEETLFQALKLFSLDVHNKSVLLKPNLVDYLPGNAVNTDPVLVTAAAQCFRRLGAASVVVAEGPGHQRDTGLVLSRSGFADRLRYNRIPFIDLNRDTLVKVKLQANYTNLDTLWLPKTVRDTQFIVSMPKVKAHHWSGVTLSMKNMFGVVPGTKYGWPKNILHWKGIQESILDVCATVPIHFVIADAVVAMEGNGPLNGTPRKLSKIILADDPVAADSTCARLMGLAPERIPHLREASKFIGNMAGSLIEQLAETPVHPSVPFQVVAEFRHLWAA